jgi:UDP-glucose 4-epimerase
MCSYDWVFCTIDCMANILVTGGAGYIGGFTTRALSASGHTVTVFDDLSAGHTAAIPEGIRFIQGNTGDAEAIRKVLTQNPFDAIIHFAAFIEAGESMVEPRRFYANNVVGGINLLDAILDTAGNNDPIPLVFSSTAAVYGMPKEVPISESASKSPVNVYGDSKLALEHVMDAYDRAYGLRAIRLRYFNACGADPSGEYGESHANETHLIPNALKAANNGTPMHIFGTDYDTPDGTCIRDYVHVADLANAHILAVEALINGAPSNQYNVGLGSGFSVSQILDVVDKVTGKTIQRNLQSRRAGDPAVLVADSSRLQAELGWKPQYNDVETIVATAWEWHRNHPNGYSPS